MGAKDRKNNKTQSSKKLWERGYGVVRHTTSTKRKINMLSRRYARTGDGVNFWDMMCAADRLTNAAMWLTVHDTYAKNVYMDGRPMRFEDFKSKPEGHTGSALNIVPAYVGYLLANSLSGHTRGWVAEQGHAVSGIDCVNLLTGNVTRAHEKYSLTDEGLSEFVRDFYSYRLSKEGVQESPRGSHVNPNTAGGIAEGGYLGFVGLEYVHMPLPGERLVAFLSDGAFEEQRGPDWVPRWWRHEDCGLATPIMILNGRRIDQRTTTTQQGGTKWLKAHLKLNSFEPVEIDGRDPADFAWFILESEKRLENSPEKYPVKYPYGIALTIKGYGFYGAGTNAAHGVPLGSNMDEVAVKRFVKHIKDLWVPRETLEDAAGKFRSHKGRPLERDNPFVNRDVSLKKFIAPRFKTVGEQASPVTAIDSMFTEICRANPHLRARIGNPDEMRSNRLDLTLDYHKHRVTDPEPGAPESVNGNVITALNEEAVACAALANKGGINLIHTYEAFGAKMLGALRQEIIFTNHCRRAGRPEKWLSVPLILTSHTYENGKNEQSHQDPVACEALLGEPAHISRVVFPADYNSAGAVMEEVYKTHAQIWTIVVPKQELPVVFDARQSGMLVKEGALKILWSQNAKIILTAIGAYQLQEVMEASGKLSQKGIEHSVIYMMEPRRFAQAKNREESLFVVSKELRDDFYPPNVRPRLFVTHTRSGRIQGLLQVIDTGESTFALGYKNEGGTLDTKGMLFVNQQSSSHILKAAARLLDMPDKDLLQKHEIERISAGLWI